MVLESVVIPESWENHPQRMLIIGFLYSTVGLFLGLIVFGKYASLSGIFLTTIPLVVIMHRAFTCEEAKDMKSCQEYALMKEHLHVLYFFIYLFLGMVISYSFWFTFLPTDIVNNVCSSQIDTISSISRQVSATGAAIDKLGRLEVILNNNLMVWGFCILFSFLYGGGAIFILTWNASVIGVAIGSVIREGLRTIARLQNNPLLINYFTVLPLGLSYLVHGLPEIVSYFLAALAGGIISVAVACHHYKSKEFWHVVWDSLDLVIVSLLVLLAAAFTEVYITPILL